VQYGHCICLKWDESFHHYPVKQAAFDLQQKESGSKTVAIATSKYTSRGAPPSVQHACQIPIVLHHHLQRHSPLRALTPIPPHPITSSAPNLHNTKIPNISGTRRDTTKRKTPLLLTPKSLSNSPTLQHLNPSFHGHFKASLHKEAILVIMKQLIIIFRW